jgi:hypothetical protein
MALLVSLASTAWGQAGPAADDDQPTLRPLLDSGSPVRPGAITEDPKQALG